MSLVSKHRRMNGVIATNISANLCCCNFVTFTATSKENQISIKIPNYFYSKFDTKISMKTTFENFEK